MTCQVVQTEHDLTDIVADPVCMPLADAARALGTTPDALRQKIKRGKLQAVRDNSGRFLVWVDPDALSAVEVSSRSVGVKSDQSDDLSSHVKSLEGHVKSLTARLEVADRQTDQLRADHKAEIDRMQAAYAAELERARLDADRARDDAKLMIEQMKDVTDRLDRERQAQVDRLQTDLEQARAELARARRPWWKRLVDL